MTGFMRSHPLDRISSTKGRSNTSDSHPALNSLLRRLSNPTRFSSFGRISGQAKVRKAIVLIVVGKNLQPSNGGVTNNRDVYLRVEVPCRDT